MTQQYYFLVAGLPDIALDEGVPSLTFSEFVEDIAEHVAPEDVSLLRIIQLTRDNANLIALLEKRDRAFLNGGNFTQGELAAQIVHPDSVPDYMQIFLEARRDGKVLQESLSEADQLNWLFYEEMSDHSNAFIRDWFGFELNLRNLLAGVNARRGLEHLVARGSGDVAGVLGSVVIGRNDVAEAVLRSGAPDFGLGTAFPWVEPLLAASRGSLQDFEKAIDALRFEMLDSLTILSGFGMESLLAAAIRFEIAERWALLDPEQGRETLKQAVAQLKSGFQIPVEFARAR